MSFLLQRTKTNHVSYPTLFIITPPTHKSMIIETKKTYMLLMKQLCILGLAHNYFLTKHNNTAASLEASQQPI